MKKLVRISTKSSASAITTVHKPRYRQPNTLRLTNPDVLDFLKSKMVKTWTGNSVADLETSIVMKLNSMIGSGDETIEGEGYEVRNQRHDNKYVHVRC